MKCLIVFVGILAAAVAKPGYYHITSPVYLPIVQQYQSQDHFGQYSYGYTDGLSAKSEVRSIDGTTNGGYSYIDAEGKLQSVHYVADPVHGFKVAATNIPEAKLEEPKPVEDTPEVAQAKKEHLEAVEQTKARDASIVANDKDVESVEVGHHHISTHYPIIPTFYHYPHYYPYASHGYPYVHPIHTYYSVPHVYTNGHQANELPTDDEAVAKARKEHEKAHEDVKAKLSAAGVEVN